MDACPPPLPFLSRRRWRLRVAVSRTGVNSESEVMKEATEAREESLERRVPARPPESATGNTGGVGDGRVDWEGKGGAGADMEAEGEEKSPGGDGGGNVPGTPEEETAADTTGTAAGATDPTSGEEPGNAKQSPGERSAGTAAGTSGKGTGTAEEDPG